MAHPISGVEISLERPGLRDRETAAYNLSYFTDLASKELSRARRHGRSFSLLTFSIDNLPHVKMRLGSNEARRASRGIVRGLCKLLRDSDVLAAASDRELYLLLPETDFFGALMVARRALAAAREDPDAKEIGERQPLGLVSGASAFPKDGDDFDELVDCCRRRMEQRRRSLQHTLLLDGLPFWDELELLLGNPDSPPLPMDERAAPSCRGNASETLFEQLQAEVARELLRNPDMRGLVYLGGPEVRAEMPLATHLEEPPKDFGSRVYALGRRGDLPSHPALTPVFLEGDERIARHEFLLWLSDNAAYAFIQRRGVGATWGFHSCDPYLVDGLINGLQSEYDLQPW